MVLGFIVVIKNVVGSVIGCVDMIDIVIKLLIVLIGFVKDV